jgi:hypothetical protein
MTAEEGHAVVRDVASWFGLPAVIRGNQAILGKGLAARLKNN